MNNKNFNKTPHEIDPETLIEMEEPQKASESEDKDPMELTLTDDETGEKHIGSFNGNIRDGKANGQGTWRIRQECKRFMKEYTGEWKDNRPHGHGVELFSDGSKYEGQYPNGVLVGRANTTYNSSSPVLKSENKNLQGVGQPIQASPDFLRRQQDLLDAAVATTKDWPFYEQMARVYRQYTEYDVDCIQGQIDRVNSRHGSTLDFRVNAFVRMLYLDQGHNNLPSELVDNITDCLLNFRYSINEPATGNDEMILWTENHYIMFHSIEVLAGELFPDQTFVLSGLTGAQQKERALPGLNKWLDSRAKFGFSEWHSNNYYPVEIAALTNLVDFAEDVTIRTRAAMLLDTIAFDMSNHYFKGLYATSMGRTSDNKRHTTDPRKEEIITNSAYLMLGLPDMQYDGPDCTDIASVSLATSNNYVPPPLLERIAAVSRNGDVFEHQERLSIGVFDGGKYGITYDPNNADDILYWWTMSAPMAGPVIDASLAVIEEYQIQMNRVMPPAAVKMMQVLANAAGVSLAEYASTSAARYAQGVALENPDIYTYRTPHYQLSGCQDHFKGWTSIQEHTWQATLGQTAYVFTNSPSLVSLSKNWYIGGWCPKATFFRNVGIIQYDRDSIIQSMEDAYREELPDDEKAGGLYVQAYFPQSEFDEWDAVQDRYLFGRKGDGYVALYSSKSSRFWSEFDWRSLGTTNCYVVEMGNRDQNGSFDTFKASILAARLDISKESKGFSVEYKSPSVGLVQVSWEGDMTVAGTAVDLGPYPRYNNRFCVQEFSKTVTTIAHDDTTLSLDFERAERNYYTNKPNDDTHTSPQSGEA